MKKLTPNRLVYNKELARLKRLIKTSLPNEVDERIESLLTEQPKRITKQKIQKVRSAGDALVKVHRSRPKKKKERLVDDSRSSQAKQKRSLHGVSSVDKSSDSLESRDNISYYPSQLEVSFVNYDEIFYRPAENVDIRDAVINMYEGAKKQNPVKLLEKLNRNYSWLYNKLDQVYYESRDEIVINTYMWIKEFLTL